MAPGPAHGTGPSSAGLRAQGRAISPLIAGVSRFRTWMLRMSVVVAGLHVDRAASRGRSRRVPRRSFRNTSPPD